MKALVTVLIAFQTRSASQGVQFRASLLEKFF